MATLRCTAKLLKRLGVEKPGEPPRAENRLGDWFANIIYTRRGHFVILVSETSLLPVLTTARDLDNLVPRFQRDLEAVLTALNVPQHAVERELELMQPVYFGRTNNRKVLGSMNDLVQSFKFMLPLRKEFTNLDWSLYLAETPCSPIDMESPSRVVPRLLKNPQGFRVIDGGKN